MRTKIFKVLIGSPLVLEDFLITHSTKFDYVIYDEIQKLNGKEGGALERIIKLMKCPFLALSATIYQPEKLRDWWINITDKPVELVKYDKRFIVQQRYLWKNNELSKLHPLSGINIEYIKSSGFDKGDLSFMIIKIRHILYFI